MELFPSDSEPACAMYKNQLQELVQKEGQTFPFCQYVNEGSSHAPKFRASVLVGKSKYTSNSTYADKIEADEDAAKLAYESLKNIRFKPQLGPLLVHQELIFCKSILHEYAVKMHLNIPKYLTIPQGGPKPVFISSLEICGKIHIGEVAENKQVEEQLAVRAAIQSLLGTLHKVIKSKEKLYAYLCDKNSTSEGNQGVPVVTEQQQSNGTIPQQKAGIQTEFINYGVGHGAFPNTGSEIKRNIEFKTRVQNKNRSYGRAVGKQN